MLLGLSVLVVIAALVGGCCANTTEKESFKDVNETTLIESR